MDVIVSMMLTVRSGRMKVSKLRRSMSNVADISNILRFLSWLMNSLSRHILSASHALYSPLRRSYSALSSWHSMPSCFIAFSTIFKSNSLLSMLSLLIHIFCKPNCIHLFASNVLILIFSMSGISVTSVPKTTTLTTSSKSMRL